MVALGASAGTATADPVATKSTPAPSTSSTAPAARLELTFAGDIMFGGTFKGRWCPQEAKDFDLLAPIRAQLAADISVANLETAVVSKIPIEKFTNNLRFAARPDQVEVLPKNGVKVVSIANNHIADADEVGIRETPKHLRDLGITALGAPRTDDGPLLRIETVEAKGWRVGFIAATTRLNRPQKASVPRVPLIDAKQLQAAVVPLVKKARADHDLVFVVLHWGVQYADDPEKWQVTAARAFIDAGANGVIGHHPHILQRLERYKDGVIAYSLGNFVFNNAMPLQRNTGVLRLGFQHAKKCLDTVVLHPAAIYPSPVHHPKPLDRSNKMFDEVVQRMTKLSAPMKITVDGDKLVAPAACTR